MVIAISYQNLQLTTYVNLHPGEKKSIIILRIVHYLVGCSSEYLSQKQGGARNRKRQISNMSTPDFNAMGITEQPKTKIFQFWSKNPSGNHTWVYRTQRLYANIRKSYILYIFSDISCLNNILRYCKWNLRWKTSLAKKYRDEVCTVLVRKRM